MWIWTDIFLQNKSQVTNCSRFYVKSIYCVFFPADVQCRPGASFHHPAQCFTRAGQSSHPGGPAAPSPDWSRGKQRKRIFSVSGVDHSRRHGSTRWFRTDGPLMVHHQVRSCACAFYTVTKGHEKSCFQLKEMSSSAPDWMNVPGNKQQQHWCCRGSRQLRKDWKKSKIWTNKLFDRGVLVWFDVWL